MTQIVGLLTKIGEKSWNNKTLYSIFVKPDGENKEVMIGLGAAKPSVAAMSRVRVSTTTNQKGYETCKPSDIELLKDEPPSVAAPSKSGGFIDRQNSIVMQSSFKAGIEILDSLLQHGLVKFTTNTKARKETAVDAYMAMLDKITVEIFNKCIDPETFLDSYVADNADYTPNPGANEAEGRPIEDDLPDF